MASPYPNNGSNLQLRTLWILYLKFHTFGADLGIVLASIMIENFKPLQPVKPKTLFIKKKIFQAVKVKAIDTLPNETLTTELAFA